MNKAVALLSAVILISGCAVGPNYKKPAVSELPLRASYKRRHNSESRARINFQL